MARFEFPRACLLLEIVALPLVKLVAGPLQSPRKALQLAGRREVQAPVEQRCRNPDSRRKRGQCSGNKDEDQSIAKPVHPIRPRADGVRGSSFNRNGPAVRETEDSPAPGFRLNRSMRPVKLTPESPTIV